MPKFMNNAVLSIFRNGGKAIADTINREAKALAALTERYSEDTDNREAIAACAARLAVHAENLERLTGDDPEVLDARYALTEYRLRLGGMAREVRMYASQLISGEEGARGALRRISTAVAEVHSACLAFREREDDRAPIAASVIKLRTLVSDFAHIEPRMAWNIGLTLKACDSLVSLLDLEIPTTTSHAPTEVRNVNLRRDQVGRALDDLRARLLCIGDPVHGGLEERQPIVDKLTKLQRIVAADPYSELSDPDALIAILREIPEQVASIRSPRSKLTGEPFPAMLAALPSLREETAKVIRLIQNGPSNAVRTLIPVVSPRQISSKSVTPITQWGFEA